MQEVPDIRSGDPVSAEQATAWTAAIREMQETMGRLVSTVATLSINGPGGDASLYASSFPAKITGNGSNGTKFTWEEWTNVGGNMTVMGTAGTDGRACSNASHASAAVEMNGATYIPAGTKVTMHEIRDGDDHRYCFQCTAAVFTITGPVGTANATNWSPYSTAQGATVWNAFEPCTTSTMSVTINANGSVGSSNCTVKQIGPVQMPCVWDGAKWVFAVPNNAGS